MAASEIMTFQSLSAVLLETISPDADLRRKAEQYLQSMQRQNNFGILLLRLLDSSASTSSSASLQMTAAVTFKNFVKRCWRQEDDLENRISREDKTSIKSGLFQLMLKSEKCVQKLLGEAVALIGREEFPHNWPQLITQITSTFTSGDFGAINTSLSTASVLFARYRYEFRSDRLWSEIKFVLENFAKPLTDLLEATMLLAPKHSSDPSILLTIVTSLVYISEIFYQLNYQDLPEFFEDNIKTWMGHFLQLLNLDNKLLLSKNDEEPGVLEQLHGQICDNITLYASRYDEEFAPYIPPFVTAVWGLLMKAGTLAKYDLLVSNGIHFLCCVVQKLHHKHLFENAQILSSICEKIIVPNMEFREYDMELFKENPDEFLRRDIEGSNIGTRRHSACELVKALSVNFEANIIHNFSAYIQSMLAQSQADPLLYWKHKDAAVFLVICVATRNSTQTYGATKTSQLVNLDEFYHTHVLGELQERRLDYLPVIKATSLKYVSFFRHQLAPRYLVDSLRHISYLLQYTHTVVYNYAAIALEKLLVTRATDKTPLIKVEDLTVLSGELFTNLLKIFCLEDQQENEYVMKALMRLCHTLQAAAIVHMSKLLQMLTARLLLVAKNPSNPYFNHYLFETLALSIRVVCAAQPSALSVFESTLFPAFQIILQNDVQEFTPYVFQVLSVMLEASSGNSSTACGTLGANYANLLPHMLSMSLWQQNANVPALRRFITVCLSIEPLAITRIQQFPALLHIIQRLIGSKANEKHAISLLIDIFFYIPAQTVDTHTQQMFGFVFQRLTAAKTPSFVRLALRLIYAFCNFRGGSHLIRVLEHVQTGLFSMVVERLIVLETPKMCSQLDRKLYTVALTQLLCDTQELMPGSVYNKYWCPLLQVLVSAFLVSGDRFSLGAGGVSATATTPVPTSTITSGRSADEEKIVEFDCNSGGYSATFAQLMLSKPAHRNYFKCDIDEPVVHLMRSLQAFSARNPGKMATICKSLDNQTLMFIEKYAQTMGIVFQ